jgi:hypothetical protein
VFHRGGAVPESTRLWRTPGVRGDWAAAPSVACGTWLALLGAAVCRVRPVFYWSPSGFCQIFDRYRGCLPKP